MGKQSVEVLIEAGKATAAPPLGPALGPTGVNIGQVVAEINKKTASMKGMQVPVKVIVDDVEKTFTITIGTPPAAALIKKEADVKKGASNPLTDKVADLKIEQIIKIAKMKEDALLGNDMKAMCKEIVGTCQSMGVMVEGLFATEALKAIDEGKYDDKISSGKTELTEEEMKILEEEKKKLQQEIEKRRTEFEIKGKDILSKFTKDNKKARKAMTDAGIPMLIVNELAPEEEKSKK